MKPKPTAATRRKTARTRPVNQIPPKRGRGKPKYVPTDKDRRFVLALAIADRGQEEICRVLNISQPTLRKYFRDEIDNGKLKAGAAVVANLYSLATKPDFKATTAAIYWTKSRLGWSDRVEIKHSGAIGMFDLTKVCDDDLAKLESILAVAAISSSGAGGNSEEGG